MAENYFLGALKRYAFTFRRLDRTFLYTLLIDLAFILLVAVVFQVFGKGMDNIIPQDYPLKAKLDGMDYMTSIELHELTDAVSAFKSRIVWYSVAFAFFVVLAYTLSRYWVYSIVSKLKIFRKDWVKAYLRFVGLNLLLVVFSVVAYLALLTLLYFLLSPFVPLSQASRIIVFILVLFFVLLINYLVISTSFVFMKETKVWRTIRLMFSSIIKRIHLALFPVFLTFLTLLLLNVLVMISLLTGELGSVFLVSILLLCFVSFIRFYYHGVLDAVLPAGEVKHGAKVKEVKTHHKK
jgi:hypothetical protein